jgi:protein-S-isoprenylcysteine O-methyltransferase Ste14
MRSSNPILHTLIFTISVPGAVAGLIPWSLRGSRSPATGVDFWVGILTFALGLAIYLHNAFWGFALRGRGTPAPIARTQKLVTEGLHNYVRNPMYVGVLLMILGQSVFFRSPTIAIYLGVCSFL